jgi:hypothetical protein
MKMANWLLKANSDDKDRALKPWGRIAIDSLW